MFQFVQYVLLRSRFSWFSYFPCDLLGWVNLEWITVITGNCVNLFNMCVCSCAFYLLFVYFILGVFLVFVFFLLPLSFAES